MKITEILRESTGLYQIKQLSNGKFNLIGPSINTADPNWSPKAVNSQGVFSTYQQAEAAAKDMQDYLEKEMSATPSIVAREQQQDMGNGVMKRTNPDGSYEISDASGIKKYDATGKQVSQQSPRFAGVQTVTGADGKSGTSYQQGPLSVNKNADGSSSTEYDLGTGVAKMSQAPAGKRTSSFRSR
jgi:hypothetical protein